jgi:polyisoprenoid-binding protein YceI
LNSSKKAWAEYWDFGEQSLLPALCRSTLLINTIAGRYTMNRRLGLILTATLGVFISHTGLALAEIQRRVEISPTESSISWVGRKVTGSHAGTVPIKEGEVMLNGAAIASGRFGIDLSGVRVTDIPDPKNNAKLVGHLKSPDFFSAELFPTVQFTIDSASPMANPLPTGENTTIKGTLSIKGISKPVEFPARVAIKDGVAEATGKAKLDRTQWDIRYGSGKFFQGLGDKLIYDEFEVDFRLKGKVVG